MDKWKFYTREAHAQIEYAKFAWAAFENSEKRECVEEIFLHLQHFLSHAAIVDKTKKAVNANGYYSTMLTFQA